MTGQATPASGDRAFASLRGIGVRSQELPALLLGASVATLGVQLGWRADIHLAISDVFLGCAGIVLLVWQRPALVAALRPWTLLHTAAAAILIALLWGTAVAFVRMGTVTTESLVNKDVGWLVLATMLVVTRAVARSSEDIARFLKYLLIGGFVVEAIAVIWFGVAVVAGSQANGLRFDGFLLNPNANGVFLSLLLMLQIAATQDSRIFPTSRWVRLVGLGFLLVLLLATLSRSSWLGEIGALLLLSLTVMRKKPWLPLACAAVLIAFSLQPLGTALQPVWSRLVQGQLPASERGYAPSATPPASVAPLLNGVTPIPKTSATQTPSTPRPSASQNPDYLTSASEIAAERYGASDRLALDILALRLWLASPASAVTGIGLGVFLAVTPFIFGVPVIIHSSYLWLPVEMGIPGTVALLLLLALGFGIFRSSKKWEHNGLAIGIVGSLFAIALWSLTNEGIYQRSLWFLLALGGTLAWRSAVELGRRSSA